VKQLWRVVKAHTVFLCVFLVPCAWKLFFSLGGWGAIPQTLMSRLVVVATMLSWLYFQWTRQVDCICLCDCGTRTRVSHCFVCVYPWLSLGLYYVCCFSLKQRFVCCVHSCLSLSLYYVYCWSLCINWWLFTSDQSRTVHLKIARACIWRLILNDI